MDLFLQLKAFIRRNDLLEPGQSILLAVSGGVDSVVMLHLFVRLREEWNLKLAVAHFNHSWRKEADSEESFVLSLARSHGLRCHTRKGDTIRYAEKKKLSPEAGARECRFAFLEEILQRTQMDRLALAHHANDQAETVLMHLLRGSGMRGMRGIVPKRGSIIHPLLGVEKEDLESYAGKNKIPFVDDRSNRDPRYLRNRYRLQVLPDLIRHTGPGAIRAICRSADAAAEAHQMAESEARRLRKEVLLGATNREIILDLNRFLGYFKMIQKALISQIVEEDLSERPIRSEEYDRILRLAYEGKSGSGIEAGQIRVRRSTDTLAILGSIRPLWNQPASLDQAIPIPSGGTLRLTRIGREEIGPLIQPRNIALLDQDRIRYPLRLRTWKEGDWFHPFGMRGKKKLQDFFTDMRIPNYRRSGIPLLVSGDDIVWVVGYRIDDRYKVTDRTRIVLRGKFNKSGGTN